MVGEKYNLSVIVPVYNAEKTIKKCMESILKQKCTLELIIIDDDSSDDTKSIVDEMKKEYSNIKYWHKRNGGVASARNLGLRKAVGRYVTFVDQDDWLDNGVYEIAIDALKRENADMYVFGYYKDYNNRSVPMKNENEIPTVVKEPSDIIKFAFYREKYRSFAAFVWNKMFRRSFLTENNVCFNEDLKRGDDVLFISEVALHSPKTIVNKESYYHYYQREDSITHTFSKDNYYRLKDILVGYEKSIELLEQNNIEVGCMKCFYVYHASLLYELSVKHNNEDEQHILREIMDRYYKYYYLQNIDYPERIERVNKFLGK